MNLRELEEARDTSFGAAMGFVTVPTLLLLALSVPDARVRVLILALAALFFLGTVIAQIRVLQALGLALLMLPGWLRDR